MGVDVVLLRPGVSDWTTLDIEPINIVLTRHGMGVASPDGNGIGIDVSTIVATTWEKAKAGNPDVVSVDIPLETNWAICEEADFLVYDAKPLSLHIRRLMQKEFYNALLFELIHGLGLVMIVDGGDLTARPDVLAAMPPTILEASNPEYRYVVETIEDC